MQQDTGATHWWGEGGNHTSRKFDRTWGDNTLSKNTLKDLIKIKYKKKKKYKTNTQNS